MSGRRTKFQKFDTAQLVVLAKSAPELLDDADRAAIRKREEEEEEKRAKEARQSGEGAVGPAYTARSREQGAPAEESAPETPEAEAPTEPAASGAAGASGASGAAGEGTDAGAGAAAEGQAAPFMPGEKGAMGLHHVTLDSLDKHQPLLEAPALKEGGVGEEEEGEVSTLDQVRPMPPLVATRGRACPYAVLLASPLSRRAFFSACAPMWAAASRRTASPRRR